MVVEISLEVISMLFVLQIGKTELLLKYDIFNKSVVWVYVCAHLHTSMHTQV